MTPLAMAADEGFLGCVTVLVEAKADVTHNTKWGTAAEQAEENGHDDVVQYLSLA
jgi:hypothetical protein